MAVQIPITLTPSIYAANNIQQLSSGQVGGMSQVVSFIVDNSTNPLPLTVMHGALNEVTTIPAMTMQTLPTFSSQGYWSWNVFTNTAPAANTNVNLILMNYERAASTVRTNSNTIQATGENSSVIINDVFILSGTNGTTNLTANGTGANWYLDSLDMGIEYMQNSANVFGVKVRLGCGLTVIETMYPQAYLAGLNEAVFNVVSPGLRSWSQGLLVPGNDCFNLNLSNTSGVISIGIRVNLSGYSL